MEIIAVAARAGVAGILTGAALAFAGQAHAGPTDDAFIAELDARGLGYSSPAVAIRNAKGVCSRIGSGVEAAAQYLQANTSYNQDQMLSFGTAAVTAYCPQLAPKL